jgi:hypothetical protein
MLKAFADETVLTALVPLFAVCEQEMVNEHPRYVLTAEQRRED